MLDLTENGGNKTTEARGGESSGSSGDVPGYNVYAHLSNHCTEASTSSYRFSRRFQARHTQASFSVPPHTGTMVCALVRGPRLPVADWRLESNGSK